MHLASHMQAQKYWKQSEHDNIQQNPTELPQTALHIFAHNSTPYQPPPPPPPDTTCHQQKTLQLASLWCQDASQNNWLVFWFHLLRSWNPPKENCSFTRWKFLNHKKNKQPQKFYPKGTPQNHTNSIKFPIPNMALKRYMFRIYVSICYLFGTFPLIQNLRTRHASCAAKHNWIW